MPTPETKFECEITRQNLLALVDAAGKAVPSKPIVSLLDCLKLDLSPEGIKVTGYDLQFGVVSQDHEHVENARGSCQVLVKRDRLTSLLGALPFDRVKLQVWPDFMVEIADAKNPEKSFFKFTGAAASDYPSIQAHSEVVAPELLLEGSVFKRMVELTRFATAYNDVRLYFNGIFFSAEGDTLTMVGTDGYRMAVVQRKLADPVAAPIRAIIPSKSVQEMARLLPEKENISLSFSRREGVDSDGHMQSLHVKWPGYETTFRLIDSAYPDWNRVVPKEKKGSAVLTRQELGTMIKALLAFSSRDQEIERGGLVTVKVSEGQLTGVSKWQSEEARFEFPVQQEGEDIEITFDGRYFVDVFGAVGDQAGEEVIFEYSDPLKQGLLRFKGDEGFRYILMPIREQ